jgi:hypothetical protein
MPSSIAFSNLFNGQEIPMPYEVNGTITVLPNLPAANLVAVSKQVDDNALQDISASPPLSVALPSAGPVSFTFELTLSDCPLPNTYYMLTLYCWDDQANAVSLASVTFKSVDTNSPLVAPVPVSPPPTGFPPPPRL